MDPALDSTWQMWAVFALIGAAIIAYSLERIALEVTSLTVIAALLILFFVFPVVGPDGRNLLNAEVLLAGFGNPALIAILALLVIGQGLFQAGALDAVTRRLGDVGAALPAMTIMLVLMGAMLTSAFLNNTPVTIMFIPILTALAGRMGRTPSKVMMPLSYICILGGMTTLIGSSTNLLAAGAYTQATGELIGFFDFTIPGIALAAVGAVYVLVAAPRLLPDRGGLATDIAGSGKQYIAQIQLADDHPLTGTRSVAGLFPPLKDMTVRMIQRGEQALLPPFEDVTLESGDVIIVAATRQTLTEALSSGSQILQSLIEAAPARPQAPGQEGEAPPTPSGRELTLVEAVVAPGSRMIGRDLEQLGFRYETHCLVLGIQRRSRMIRARMSDIRLEAGDVLLVLGSRRDVEGLRLHRDVLLLEWSATELPDLTLATRARAIFAATIAVAATGLLPIVAAAAAGAAAMIVAGVLNVRQAARAVDRRIILLVGAALAMAASLEMTGGALFLAQTVVNAFAGAPVPVVLSALFLLIALMTNVLSNNATAVLFTPIAINAANELGIDPAIGIYSVIFAANCSFATPMAYQTNLLVMGPGHYNFRDFVRVGAPLVLVIWLAYSIIIPWYYGIG